MRRATLVATGVAATALVAHAAPSIGRIGPVWRLLLPGLAGLGSPDHVAITFDDGPDPESTPAFLAALDEQGWKATFFMLGRMVRAAPGLAGEVAAAGHDVAVHGDEHRSHLRRLPTDVGDDVRRATEAIAEATGRRPAWFRPPYGELSAAGVLAARRLRLRPVLWTTWGRDWRAEATPTTVVADVARGLRPGATVLLHDSDCTSAPGAWRSALGSLPALAELFEARGMRAGPLSEHGIAGAGGMRATALAPGAAPLAGRTA